MPHRQIQLQSVPGLWPLTWPMGLTMLRLLLLPVFLWLLLADADARARAGADDPPPYHWWAIGVFVVMAATDKLDGYLARKLGQASRIGALLDPVADKLLIASSIVLLSFRWVAPEGFAIPMYVVLAVYGKDLVVALGCVALLYLVGQVTIKPRILGKVGVVLQLALVLLTMIAADLHARWPTTTRPALAAMGWAVFAVSVASCVDYVLLGIRQLKESRHARQAGAAAQGAQPVAAGNN